jgi:hypothetical protein
MILYNKSRLKQLKRDISCPKTLVLQGFLLFLHSRNENFANERPPEPGAVAGNP